MLVSNPAIKQVDLSKWKVVIGGARLPKGLAKAATELGIEIFAGYGMSETCPLVSIANLKPAMLTADKDAQLDRLIATGLPAPLVYARIVDAKGNELPRNGTATGELVVRAPWLTESYYNDPERTKDLWRDGWLHTGDVAYIDEEGYIQITDRIKDVIKTGGEWISSLELENLISQHPAVSEAAAIGVADTKWGERPALVIVVKPDFKDKVTAEELKQFMAKCAEDGKIPKYGVPDRYIIVEEIPKTSVGKINKIELRKVYP
jgi:fatty-acyl-CoA synthase